VLDEFAAIYTAVSLLLSRASGVLGG